MGNTSFRAVKTRIAPLAENAASVARARPLPGALPQQNHRRTGRSHRGVAGAPGGAGRGAAHDRLWLQRRQRQHDQQLLQPDDCGRGRARLASASRVYLDTTLGERIVADLRRDVFSHLTSLSPAYFDSTNSGGLVSRLTADTTQIKAAVVVSLSTALRNFMLFAGASAMMVVSSPRPSGTLIAAIPLIVLHWSRSDE